MFLYSLNLISLLFEDAAYSDLSVNGAARFRGPRLFEAQLLLEEIRWVVSFAYVEKDLYLRKNY